MKQPGDSLSGASELPSAYGGEGWRPRAASLREELGSVWAACGSGSEYGTLRAVLLHRPGTELDGLEDPDAAQMLAPVDTTLLREQHDAMAAAYREQGVTVHRLEPHRLDSGGGSHATLAQGAPVNVAHESVPSNAVTSNAVPPNTMFMADLFFMTPEGAVLARPASTVRAGEERLVARRLLELGVPILHSVHGRGTFEGADAMWLDERTALVATGLRTNDEGAAQVAATLQGLGAEVIRVDLPYGAMHLMGSLRLLAPGLAAVWGTRLPHRVLRVLEERGQRVVFLPDEAEGRRMALNVVALKPGVVLMPAGCPHTQSALEGVGVTCLTVEIGEIAKAAGGMGCLTGVLQRDSPV